MKADKVVDDAKASLGMELDQELAEWFGVDPASVYHWRNRGLPQRRVAELALYALTGKKPTKRVRA